MRGIGELKLEVPEFVKIEQDVAAQTAKLTVEDDNIKQQKEMWGMLTFLSHLA